MTILAIDWSSIGIKALQFILSFSILVTLHEMGHYFPAKWFKCRVEKFYLFFNPWFSLYKKQKGETEYGIGWIPFGGYVKISGMMDESMDKEQMKLPPQPHEFRSKKAWQRLIIMIGGVVVNVVLAIVIFIGIAWVWGDKFVPTNNLKYGVYADSLGKKIGLKDGDKIIMVGNKKLERVGTTGAEIIMQQAKEITIDRNNEIIKLKIPEGFISQLNKNKLEGFCYVRYPLVVDSLDSKFKLPSTKILKGDVLISFAATAIQYSTDLLKLDKPINKSVNLVFLRNGKDTITQSIYFNEKGENCIMFGSIGQILGEEHIKYSFFKAIPVGWNKCWETLNKYILNLKLLFTSKEVKVKDSLGSVFSIANTFGGKFDWQSFWTLTGVFSIILAFMNILPIPALDGGHALFTLIEMITGKKPSDKFMEVAQTIGMVLLLSLMAYALGLDVWRFFK